MTINSEQIHNVIANDPAIPHLIYTYSCKSKKERNLSARDLIEEEVELRPLF